MLKTKQQSDIPAIDPTDTLPGGGDDTLPGGSGDDTLPTGEGDNTIPGGSTTDEPGSDNPNPDKEETDMSGKDNQEKYTVSDFADAVETLWPDKEGRPSRYAVHAAFAEAGVTTATKAEGIKLVDEFMTKEVN